LYLPYQPSDWLLMRPHVIPGSLSFRLMNWGQSRKCISCGAKYNTKRSISWTNRKFNSLFNKKRLKCNHNLIKYLSNIITVPITSNSQSNNRFSPRRLPGMTHSPPMLMWEKTRKTYCICLSKMRIKQECFVNIRKTHIKLNSNSLWPMDRHLLISRFILRGAEKRRIRAFIESDSLYLKRTTKSYKKMISNS